MPRYANIVLASLLLIVVLSAAVSAESINGVRLGDSYVQVTKRFGDPNEHVDVPDTDILGLSFRRTDKPLTMALPKLNDSGEVVVESRQETLHAYVGFHKRPRLAVYYIRAYGPEYRTERGIHPGSTEKDVLKAYGRPPGKWGDIADTAGMYVYPDDALAFDISAWTGGVGSVTLYDMENAGTQQSDEVPNQVLPRVESNPAVETVTVKVCPESGKLANDYCPNAETREFPNGEEPTDVCDIHKNPEGEGMVWVTVCKESGMLATERCPETERREYRISEAPGEECTIHTPLRALGEESQHTAGLVKRKAGQFALGIGFGVGAALLTAMYLLTIGVACPPAGVIVGMGFLVGGLVGLAL